PNVEPDSMAAPTITAVTFSVMLVASLLGKGAVRLWAPLIGVIAGYLVAAAFGALDMQRFHDAAWFGLPAAAWPGLDLSFNGAFFALLPGFILVTIIGAIETYGDGVAIQRLSRRERRPIEFKVVQGAVNADGL